MGRIQKAATLLGRNYADFINEERWNEQFELPWELFIEQVADTNMRIFMGKGTAKDFKLNDHRRPRTEVRKVHPRGTDIEMSHV